MTLDSSKDTPCHILGTSGVGNLETKSADTAGLQTKGQVVKTILEDSNVPDFFVATSWSHLGADATSLRGLVPEDICVSQKRGLRGLVRS